MESKKSIFEQIFVLEKSLLTPEVRKSPEKLGKLLAEDFIEFGSSGRVYNKEEIIQELQEGTGEEIAIHDFEVATLATGIALATYRAVKSGEAHEWEKHSLRSSLWILRDGRWQIVFHQGTPTER